MTSLIKRVSGLNLGIRRFPALYRAARNHIERFEDMDFEQRLEHRRVRLARTLKVAGYGSRVELMDLPFMSKADVRANPARYRRWTWMPESRAITSGTNGEPMEVSRSLASVVFEQAAIDWIVSRGGYDFVRDRVAVLRATTVVGVRRGDKVGRLHDNGRILELPANDLSSETFPAFMDALRSFKPKIMHVMPSAAEYLAELMIEKQLTLEIPLIVASSEVLSASARRKFHDVFGARLVDHYGQSERVCAAYSVEPGQYRFIGSYGVPEFVRSGEDWEVAGTGLHNTSQLLVRYRTGDLVAGALAEADIPKISLGLLPFGGIEGRRADALIGRDGRRSVAMNYVPRGLEEYGRFQFVQDRPHQVTIKVAGWSPGVKDKPDPVIRRARMMVPEDFEVDVAFVDTLERTCAGKTPFIIRRF